MQSDAYSSQGEVLAVQNKLLTAMLVQQRFSSSSLPGQCCSPNVLPHQ